MTAPERLGGNHETLRVASDGNSRLYQKAVASLLYGQYPPREMAGRALLQTRFGDYGAALSTLALVDDPNADVIQAYIKLADTRREQGDRDAASNVLERALTVAEKVSPGRDGYDQANQFTAVADSYARLGLSEQAVASLESLKDGFENGRINSLYGVAVTLAANGNEDGSLQVAEEFDEPRERDYAIALIGEHYAEQGDFESMDRILKIVTTPNLGTMRAYRAAAKYSVQNGDSETARSMTRNAVQVLEDASENEHIKTFWQSELVDFSLEDLHATEIALNIAEQMPPDISTVHAYADIAKAQHQSGNEEAVKAALARAKQNADEISEDDGRGLTRLKAQVDVVGAYMEVGLVTEGQEHLRALQIPDRELAEIVSIESFRGNFELAQLLIDQLPATHRSAMLTKIAADMVSHNMSDRAGGLLYRAENALASRIAGAKGDDHMKEARESHYSFGEIARTWSKAGNNERARYVLDQAYQVLHETREGDNRGWYNNTMASLVQYAIPVGAFGIAQKATAEISWSTAKNTAHSRIAQGFLEQGQITACLEELRLAEEEADKIEREEGDYKPASYLKISNIYLQLENLPVGNS